jgi:FlaG/FlaF family flagellin (archaellin)
MLKRTARLAAVAAVVILAALFMTSLLFAYSTNFDDLALGPIDGQSTNGITFHSDVVYVADWPIGFSTLSGQYAFTEGGGYLEIAFDEPQDVVSFTFAYDRNGIWATGTLNGQTVYEQFIEGEPVEYGPPPVLTVLQEEFVDYEGSVTLYGRIDTLLLTFESGIAIDNLETSVLPDEEPTPAAPMSCTTGDRSLNADHCGRPVAIFARNGGFAIYGIDINTGWGALASEISAEQIEAVGIPTDGPVAIAEGQNPYNYQPFTLYRLPSGEFQLNTYYWDGKPYAVKWEGTSPVKVVTW